MNHHNQPIEGAFSKTPVGFTRNCSQVVAHFHQTGEAERKKNFFLLSHRRFGYSTRRQICSIQGSAQRPWSPRLTC